MNLSYLQSLRVHCARIVGQEWPTRERGMHLLTSLSKKDGLAWFMQPFLLCYVIEFVITILGSTHDHRCQELIRTLIQFSNSLFDYYLHKLYWLLKMEVWCRNDRDKKLTLNLIFYRSRHCMYFPAGPGQFIKDRKWTTKAN